MGFERSLGFGLVFGFWFVGLVLTITMFTAVFCNDWGKLRGISFFFLTLLFLLVFLFLERHDFSFDLLRSKRIETKSTMFYFIFFPRTSFAHILCYI